MHLVHDQGATLLFNLTITFIFTFTFTFTSTLTFIILYCMLIPKYFYTLLLA